MKAVNKTGLAAGLLLLSVVILYMFVIHPLTWKSRVHRESIRLLEAAQTTNELAQAVGYLGLFLSFPDHSWMAIRYRDSHSCGVNSMAVARDQGGKWFHADRHFCGYLSAYPKIIEMQLSIQRDVAVGRRSSAPYLMEGFEEIHTLATSPNLATARTNLLALGFTEMLRK